MLTETPRLAPREGQPADWRRWPPRTNQRRVLSTERAALCREKTPPGALTAERSQRPAPLPGPDRLTRAGGPNAAGDSGLKPVLTGRSEDPRPLRLTLSLLCPGCRNGAMSRMAARPPAAALAEGCKRTAEADCSGKRCLSQYARSLPRLWSPKSSDGAGREGGHLHAPAHGARPAALGPGAIPTLRPYYLRNAFRKAAAATGSDSSGGAGRRGLKTF